MRLPGPTRHRDVWGIWYKRLEADKCQFPFAQTGWREIAAWELGVQQGGHRPAQGSTPETLWLPPAASEERAELEWPKQ